MIMGSPYSSNLSSPGWLIPSWVSLLSSSPSFSKGGFLLKSLSPLSHSIPALPCKNLCQSVFYPKKNYPRQLTYKNNSLIWSQMFCGFGLWLVPLRYAHGETVRSVRQQNCPVPGHMAKEREEKVGISHSSITRRPPTSSCLDKSYSSKENTDSSKYLR